MILSSLLKSSGLQAEGQKLYEKLELLKRSSLAELRAMLVGLGIRAGLLAIAGVCALATLFCVIAALYYYLLPITGPSGAFTICAGVLAVVAVLAVVISLKIRQPDFAEASASASTVAPSETPEARHSRSELPPEPQPGPSQTTADLKSSVISLLSPVLADRLGARAALTPQQVASASNQVVDSAADLLRTGPRSAIYGVLAATVVLTWFATRRHGPRL